MALDGARIWLATRGADRAPFYQSELSRAFERAGAEVEIVSFEGLLKSAASDIGNRAGELLGGAANRLARLAGLPPVLPQAVASDEPSATGEGSEAASAEDDADGAEAADIVLIDDPRLRTGVRALLKLRRGDPTVIGLVDDFRVETRWRSARVDGLIIPTEILVGAHASSDSDTPIEIAGPPVATTLRTQKAPAEHKSELGIPETPPVILVAAEGMHRETISGLVFQLTLVEEAANLVFHTGDDDEAAGLVREAASAYGLKANLLGAVDSIARYYGACDLLLVDASDPALLELTQAGRPLVLVGEDRGAARADFLTDMAAVTRVSDIVQLGAELDQLIASGAADTVARAGELVKTSGCDDVVAAVERIVSARAAAPRSPEPKAAESAPGETTAPASELPSVFEPIGAKPTATRNEPTISLAEAKSQMARLILGEREAERALGESVKRRDMWLGRLELARESADAELVEVATVRVDECTAEVGRLNHDIETLRRSKEKLKARVARRHERPPQRDQVDETPGAPAEPPAPDYESRFRRMEIERDLNRLRRKIEDDN